MREMSAACTMLFFNLSIILNTAWSQVGKVTKTLSGSNCREIKSFTNSQNRGKGNMKNSFFLLKSIAGVGQEGLPKKDRDKHMQKLKF